MLRRLFSKRSPTQSTRQSPDAPHVWGDAFQCNTAVPDSAGSSPQYHSLRLHADTCLVRKHTSPSVSLCKTLQILSHCNKTFGTDVCISVQEIPWWIPTRSSVTKHLQGHKTIAINWKCPVGLSGDEYIFQTQTWTLIKMEENSGGNRSVKKARLNCTLSLKLTNWPLQDLLYVQMLTAIPDDVTTKARQV
jgi:hypothetical protein